MKQIKLIHNRRPRRYSEIIEKEDGAGSQVMAREMIVKANYGGTIWGRGGVEEVRELSSDQSKCGQNMLVLQSGDQLGGSSHMTRKYNNQLNK